MWLLAGAVLWSSSAGELLDKMVGPWVLKGTIAGAQTVHDVTGKWVLNRGYLELNEVSRERDAAGRPAYEALVLLSVDKKTDECSCLWLDTTSNAGLAPGGVAHGRASGEALSFQFGKSFKTTFLFESDGSWKWVMDGNGQPFARVTLTHQ